MLLLLYGCYSNSLFICSYDLDTTIEESNYAALKNTGNYLPKAVIVVFITTVLYITVKVVGPDSALFEKFSFTSYI